MSFSFELPLPKIGIAQVAPPVGSEDWTVSTGSIGVAVPTTQIDRANGPGIMDGEAGRIAIRHLGNELVWQIAVEGVAVDYIGSDAA